MILQALKNMYPKASEKVLKAVMKDLEKCRAQKQWICREFTRSAKFGWQITGLYHSKLLCLHRRDSCRSW